MKIFISSGRIYNPNPKVSMNSYRHSIILNLFFFYIWIGRQPREVKKAKGANNE